MITFMVLCYFAEINIMVFCSLVTFNKAPLCGFAKTNTWLGGFMNLT